MKYIKLFESEQERYVIVGYSKKLPEYFWFLNNNDRVTTRKINDTELHYEKIFNNEDEAKKILIKVKQIWNDSTHDIDWIIEEYDIYNLKRTAKKYNL